MHTGLSLMDKLGDRSQKLARFCHFYMDTGKLMRRQTKLPWREGTDMEVPACTSKTNRKKVTRSWEALG